VLTDGIVSTTTNYTSIGTSIDLSPEVDFRIAGAGLYRTDAFLSLANSIKTL